MIMNTSIDPVPTIPYKSIGAYAFAAEHDWPSLLEDQAAKEAPDGIEGDFQYCVHDRASLAARLASLLESVAADDCLGCRNVACRIVMLIEDLEDQVQDHRLRSEGR
jgi:hypothetical protein